MAGEKDANGRREERYIIDSSRAGEFTGLIRPFSEPQTFVDRYAHTIYFNNQEHELPFEVLIRARRYADGHLDGHIDMETAFTREVKVEIEPGNTEKEREAGTFGSIMAENAKITKVLSNPITSPLVPYVATSYERTHYGVGDGCRVTVDNDVRYYVMEGLTAIPMATEDGTRVEVKTQNGYGNAAATKIKEALAAVNAEPIIQKKVAAYNLLCEHLRSRSGARPPAYEIEIESKLLLSGEHQYVIHSLKGDFLSGAVNDFEIFPEMPHTLERGKIYRYLFADDGVIRRINKGEGLDMTYTTKGGREIVDDAFGLGCIVKRRETERAVPASLERTVGRSLERRRKYIVVRKKSTGDTYSVQVDVSAYERERMFQVEIEGLAPDSPGAASRTAEDVALLTRFAVRKYPFLSPTKLTKEEWLRSIS
ncbi:MAG: hypothetical protein M1286_01420 [Candidatus Marsarchaeota archaeon]|nr:hypothetical protein [Candidatus Marsarchaeota archaeon]